MRSRLDDTTGESSWGEWMRALGRRARHVREFLGLTQDELGRMAGVSQGAISRLESGRGLATPLLVVVKIGGALQQALAGVDQAMLSPEARRMIEEGFRLTPPASSAVPHDSPLTNDPALEEYVQLFHRVPDKQRGTFLAVVRATAKAVRMPDSPECRTGPEEASGG